MPQIKAAIAGLGFMGFTHLEALRRLGHEVVGILGADQEEGNAAAARMGVKRVYRTMDELAADTAVEIVHICTPNYLHYPMAKAALLAGKHIICEKPLANTSAEGAELLELARARRLVAAVNYNLRFYPLNQEAHARLRAGLIGEPKLIHGQYCQDWLFLPTDWNWRLDPALGGKLRAVADIGTHWFDLVTWISGQQISALMADLATIVPSRLKPHREVETFASKLVTAGDGEQVAVHTEDYGAILLRFSGGARGVLMVSQVSAGRKNNFWWEINGSKASLSWGQENPNHLWIGYREKPNEIMFKDPALMQPSARPYAGFPGGHAEGYPDTFFQLFKSVYSYIAAGDYGQPCPFATFEDGWRELVLCEAVEKSASEQRWVEIPTR